MTRPRISIVGGGVAGLTLAATLDPTRYEVVLHEQAPGRFGLRTALGMWPSAQRVLQGLGLRSLLAAGSDVTGGALYDIDGNRLATPPVGTPLRLVGRTDLMAALDGAVPAAVRRTTGRVTDPDGLEAALVVGADGVHSIVRRHGWGAAGTTRLTPTLAVRGLVTPGDEPYGEFWGRGALFGITPVPGDRTNWFCAFASGLGPRDVPLDGAVAAAQERFAATAVPIRTVLHRLEPEATLAQRIWLAPPLGSYRLGRTVLIGDAAHAMRPNLGRGACDAMVDAWTLGRLLNRTDIESALRGYGRRRTVPSQLARAGSSVMSAIATTQRFSTIRDDLLRSLPMG